MDVRWIQENSENNNLNFQPWTYSENSSEMYDECLWIINFIFYLKCQLKNYAKLF